MGWSVWGTGRRRDIKGREMERHWEGAALGHLWRTLYWGPVFQTGRMWYYIIHELTSCRYWTLGVDKQLQVSGGGALAWLFNAPFVDCLEFVWKMMRFQIKAEYLTVWLRQLGTDALIWFWSCSVWLRQLGTDALIWFWSFSRLFRQIRWRRALISFSCCPALPEVAISARSFPTRCRLLGLSKRV